MIYNVSTIEVQPGKGNDAVAAVGTACERGDVGGTLIACLVAEIGALNKVLVIHAHADGSALLADRERMLMAGNPFGVADFATTLAMDSFALFPGVEFMPPGDLGPVFEVRNYRLKRGGLAATFAAWDKVRVARAKVSPLAAVMYATSGIVPRFMHIWPFRTLNERLALRADAVKQGIWPPPGGLPHIEAMQSEIYLPAAFSPLR
jgi:hypothetical protein